MRSDFLAYDLSGERIGESPLEAVAHLDPRFPVIAGYKEQHAVVFSLPSDPVGFGHPKGVLLDVFSVQRGDHEHNHLRRSRLVERREELIELRDLFRRERPREIGRIVLQLRHGGVLSRRGGGQDRQERKSTAHRENQAANVPGERFSKRDHEGRSLPVCQNFT